MNLRTRLDALTRKGPVLTPDAVDQVVEWLRSPEVATAIYLGMAIEDGQMTKNVADTLVQLAQQP